MLLSIAIPTQMEPSFFSKEIYVWVQENHYVLTAKTSLKREFPCNYLHQLLECVRFYIATDIAFQLLSTLFLSKPVPGELIMAGICEVNVLIWLQFHQAFPWL
jgi:hypothetical protein